MKPEVEADPLAKLLWEWGSQTIGQLEEADPKWLTTPSELQIARWLRAHGVADPE